MRVPLKLQPMEIGTVAPRDRLHRWAPATVMAGSLVTIVPVVSTIPILPPFGLLVLLAWRLYRPDSLKVWAAAPLGLFDDLLSGQPMGSATLLWSLCLLGTDLLDTRLLHRVFWQDWLIATAAISVCLVAGRIFAGTLSSPVDGPLLVQVLLSAMLFPRITRLCGWMTRRSART